MAGQHYKLRDLRWFAQLGTIRDLAAVKSSSGSGWALYVYLTVDLPPAGFLQTSRGQPRLFRSLDTLDQLITDNLKFKAGSYQVVTKPVKFE